MTCKNIGEAPLFASCPRAERDLLRTLVVPLRISSGEDVVHQGDFGSMIGVILEGRASVWRNGEHVADLESGDCFGELAALAPPSSGAHRTASVHADTKVRVDTITARELNRELSSLPNVAEALRALGAAHRG